MRIAQIAPPWIAISPQSYGGTERIISHLVEALVAAGHDVTLIAPEDARTSARRVSFTPCSLIAEGVPWQANLKAYYHLHKAVDYVVKHDFDIVHTHLSSSGDMYLFPLSASLNMPHITTLHSYFPFDRGPEQWVGDADAHFMDWASSLRFVASSENACHQQRLPIIFSGVVHHGIPTAAYYRPEIECGDYFLWMGRFTRRKGPHLAIEAALRANVPLILAGIKESHNPDALDYFHHLIEPYIDEKQIRFLSSADAHKKVELLNGARGFLYPVESEEPFGTAMIEAMACGCPVIAFAHGAAPEIVVHGKTGFLTRNLEEMVQGIQRIDEIKRTVVQQYTGRHFSARAMAEKYVHIYQQVITGRTTGGERSRNTEPLKAITLPAEAESAYSQLTI